MIKLRAIGDVVLSTIVLPNLCQAFPDAKIDFLTESASEPVVAGNPNINDVIILDRSQIENLPPGKQLLEGWNLIQQIKNNHYDIIFDFFGNPRSALITGLSGAQLKVGYNWRARKFAYNHVVELRADRVHEAEFHLDALRSLGIPIVKKELYFPIDQNSLNFARDFLIETNVIDKFLVGINCSGGWRAKRWALSKFATLADRMVTEFNASILLFWGPGEHASAQKIRQLMKRTGILIPPTNLTQLGALLKYCKLVASNDSGPMHIAAALQTPTVGIFGPTQSNLQGPFGEMHEVAEKKELDCLGCNKTSCDHNSCMTKLTVDDVWKAVIRCVEKNRLFF